jgi:DNA processing protein
MLANLFAKKLAEYGCIIISGLALGIDGAAHEGALEVNGTTIAVLGNGLDSIYPRQHETLAKRMIQNNGCLISEYPAGTPSYPSNFLERNSIVAGISSAIIVIEAPIRSGSIATARLAAEYGRDVFVVPGPIHNKNYEGSHMLIRNGARLIGSIENLIDDLGLCKIISKKKQNEIDCNQETQIIINALKNTQKPIGVDAIVEITHIEPQKVQEILTLLALDEVIKDCGGSFILMI